MLDCTTNNYETLYARWLEKPGSLLDWAEYRPEQRLLDLCGGTGAVSKEALARGAPEVWLADLNPRVDDPRIQTIRTPAEQLGIYYDPRLPEFTPRAQLPAWDLIVCRQALGYLDLPRLASALGRALPVGGRFVFNTFVRPKFAAKMYRHDGRLYFEASAFVGRHVFHLQAMDGDFDVTHFHWWTEQDVRDAFVTSGLFGVRQFRNTSSTFWFDLEKLTPKELHAEEGH